MTRPKIRTSAVVLALAAAVVCGSPSTAAAGERRVYVGEPTTDTCGPDVAADDCIGPSRFRYKPRKLLLVQSSDVRVRVTRIRWRHWGKRRAVGRGRTRLSDPTGGYHQRRVRIVLRHIVRASCAEQSDGPRAYALASLHGPASAGFQQPIQFQTLGC